MNEQPIKSRKKTTNFWLVIITLGCAVWFSYVLFQEAKYSLYGETAVAKVTHKKQESRGGGRGSSPYQVLVLDYSFRETSGTQCEGRDEVHLGSPLIQADETVQVEYIPGIVDSSRVKGAHSLYKELLGGPSVFLSAFFFALLLHMVKQRQLVNAELKPKQQEADLRAAIGSPPFSEKALIYRDVYWIGKPVAVIVDQDSRKIHFQNCHRPKSFLPAKKHPWFSCSLSDLRGVHVNHYKGNSSLFIVTQAGSATVPSSGSNFKILKEKLPALLPQGQQCFNSENPFLGILYAIAITAGVVLTLALPMNVSDGVFVLAMFLGGGIGFGIARAIVAMAQS
jgi:hypothetical protein